MPLAVEIPDSYEITSYHAQFCQIGDQFDYKGITLEIIGWHINNINIPICQFGKKIYSEPLFKIVNQPNKKGYKGFKLLFLDYEFLRKKISNPQR